MFFLENILLPCLKKSSAFAGVRTGFGFALCFSQHCAGLWRGFATNCNVEKRGRSLGSCGNSGASQHGWLGSGNRLEEADMINAGVVLGVEF